MRLNQAGIDLIKNFEGCKLQAYPDPATGAEPWTIGYGHTGPEVRPGLIWTQGDADTMLMRDLDQVCGEIEPIIKIDLSDNEFSALVSLVYNIGLSNFRSSTMLKMINAGGVVPAAGEFEKWDHAAGRVMAGLYRRRLAERALFLKS